MRSHAQGKLPGWISGRLRTFGRAKESHPARADVTSDSRPELLYADIFFVDTGENQVFKVNLFAKHISELHDGEENIFFDVDAPAY